MLHEFWHRIDFSVGDHISVDVRLRATDEREVPEDEPLGWERWGYTMITFVGQPAITDPRYRFPLVVDLGGIRVLQDRDPLRDDRWAGRGVVSASWGVYPPDEVIERQVSVEGIVIGILLPAYAIETTEGQVDGRPYKLIRYLDAQGPPRSLRSTTEARSRDTFLLIEVRPRTWLEQVKRVTHIPNRLRWKLQIREMARREEAEAHGGSSTEDPDPLA